jgi:hypothetical protein
MTGGIATTSKAAFATPDREGLEPAASKTSVVQSETTPKAPNSVTPPESAAREQGTTTGGKQVRFDAEKTNGGTKPSEGTELLLVGSPDGKGLVSRRGGRYGSPGRSRPKDAVLEYKTYRSPQRVRLVVKDENDAVPSLCSSKSGELTCTSSACDVVASGPLQNAKPPETEPLAMKDSRPNSISVDPSQAETTSPLTSSPATKKGNKRAMTPPKRVEMKEEKRLMHSPPNRPVASLPADKVS